MVCKFKWIPNEGTIAGSCNENKYIYMYESSLVHINFYSGKPWVVEDMGTSVYNLIQKTGWARHPSHGLVHVYKT